MVGWGARFRHCCILVSVFHLFRYASNTLPQKFRLVVCAGVLQRSWLLWNDWIRRFVGSHPSVWCRILPNLRLPAQRQHWVDAWVLDRNFSVLFLAREANAEFCSGTEDGDEEGLAQQGCSNREALRHLYTHTADYITHSRSLPQQ